MDRRLRLFVCRNGLPDVSYLHIVKLANDPTIYNLLEQVNGEIPLEDAHNNWDLKAYVVELHVAPSKAFECLHFQSVSTLLEKDDEVFIRPLTPIERQKRILGGRHQILPSGEHIVDGVPPGRPRLRDPRGRPPVNIPPQKPRRLLDSQEYDLDDDLEQDDDEDGDFHQEGPDQLQLKYHADGPSGPRNVRFSDTVEEEEDGEDDDENQNMDQDMDDIDDQELADEADYLQRDLLAHGQAPPIARTRSKSATVTAKGKEGLKNADDLGPVDDAGDDAQLPSVQAAAPRLGLSDTALLDKIHTIKFAFPHAPHDVCVKLLEKHNMDVNKAWTALTKTLRPRCDLAETMVYATQLEMTREIQLVSSPARSQAEVFEDISRIGVDEEADTSSSEDEDASDSSDDPSEHQYSPAAAGDDSDIDDESDGVAARRATPRKGQDDDDSSSDSSSSDSEDEAGTAKLTTTPPAPSRTKARPRHHRKSTSDASPHKNNTSASSSEEETTVNKPTRRRGRKIVESSPVKSPRSARTTSAAKTAATEANDEDSNSDSSDSSSASSSESSSASESEDAAPVVQTEPRRKETRPKDGAGTVHQVTPKKATPVPPGQGMTRTQKRNQRRRVEKRAKQAALQTPQGIAASDSNFEARKAALLQKHTTDSTAPSQDSLQAKEDVQMVDQDTDAWREKISYRAVECVQEGVELSQPPFPFVQRWDPQQRWDAQPKQRHGKRKSRGDSQFYDEEGSQSAKKRRFLAIQEDIVLDYDDASFHPDDETMANAYTGPLSRDADEQAVDDLPPLPEDMTTLAELRADDTKVGMVIAWKQLLCNEATQWQPLLSDFMTGTVTQNHEGEDGFQVQLASRDRSTYSNERKYDEETGERIYGKFEAPDEDEEEEEDLGFRDISFPEMIEPRIVQQAPETNGVHTSGEDPTGDVFPKRPEPDLEVPQLPELGFEVADSQPQQTIDNNDPPDTRIDSLDQSGTLDHEQGAVQTAHNVQVMDIDETEMDAPVEDSFVPDTVHDQANSPGDGISISEDRRGEINELINEGGFREEVRSSIDQSDFLDFRPGSPSRQLEEEYANSVLLSTREGASNASSEAPSEYNSKEPGDSSSAQPCKAASDVGLNIPSNQDASRLAKDADADADMFHSAPQTPSPAQLRSDRVNIDDSTVLTTPVGPHSTGKVEYPNLGASQTTDASELSGRRQLDPNFVPHSDDLGNSRLEDDSSIMHDFDDDYIAGMDEPTHFSQADREKTPTQETYNNNNLSNASAPHTPPRAGQMEDTTLSISPGSAETSDSDLADVKDAFSVEPEIKAESQDDGSRPPPARQPSFPLAQKLTSSTKKERTEDSFSSPHATKQRSPSPMRRCVTGKGKASRNGNTTKSKGDNYKDSISPPNLSKSRQERASSGPKAISGNSVNMSLPRTLGPDKMLVGGPTSASGNKKRNNKSRYSIPKDAEIIEISSSPSSPKSASQGEIEEPEPSVEEEPELSVEEENYADDAVDGDYEDHVDGSPLPKSPKKLRKSQPRDLSVPLRTEATKSPGCVGGSQSASRGPTSWRGVARRYPSSAEF